MTLPSGQKLVFPDWKKIVVFAEDGPKPQILLENDQVKVLVAGLEAGQKIPSHPGNLAIYHFLQGKGRMMVDGEAIPVETGATIITPQGAARGIEAESRLVFLATRIA